MPGPDIHTAEEMHDEWFPYAPLDLVEEFWDSLRIVSADDATLADWKRHGSAYEQLQRFRVPTITID